MNSQGTYKYVPSRSLYNKNRLDLCEYCFNGKNIILAGNVKYYLTKIININIRNIKYDLIQTISLLCKKT